MKEVVTSSQEGGASLNILSGLVAGNFSAYWLGMAMMGLMAIGLRVSTQGMDDADAGSGGVRVWPGGVRIPGHGAGDHCGGFLRSGDG